MDKMSVRNSGSGSAALLTLVAGPAFAVAPPPAIALSDAYAAPVSVPSELALMIWLPLVGLTLLCALGLLWVLWLDTLRQERSAVPLADSVPARAKFRPAASTRETITLRQLSRRRARLPHRRIPSGRYPHALR